MRFKNRRNGFRKTSKKSFIRRTYSRSSRKGAKQYRALLSGAGKLRPSPYRRAAYRMYQIGAPKWYNTTTGSASIGNTWLAFYPTFPAGGTGATPRPGPTLFLRYLRFRCFLNNNNSNNEWIRILVLWPKNINIVPSSTYLPTGGQNVAAPVDVQYWSVILDKVINLGNQNASGYSNSGLRSWVPFNYTLKVMKKYSFNNAASVTPNETFPYICFYANDAVTPYPVCYYQGISWYTST